MWIKTYLIKINYRSFKSIYTQKDYNWKLDYGENLKIFKIYHDLLQNTSIHTVDIDSSGSSDFVLYTDLQKFVNMYQHKTQGKT